MFNVAMRWLGLGETSTHRPREAPTRENLKIGASERYRALPASEDGWRARYDWLLDWYEGREFDATDAQKLRLFLAKDTAGNVMVETKRACNDLRFVVETNVHAIAGGRWSLRLSGSQERADATDDARAERVQRGEAVWRRSELQRHKAAYVRSEAIYGTLLYEALLDTPTDARIVAHDPQHVLATYSPDGSTMERCVIKYGYWGEPDETGISALRIRRRTLTKTETVVEEQTKDGEWIRDEAASGVHNLGVVPVYHARWREIVGLPEHGLPAAHGMLDALAAHDSMMAQIQAMGTRYGHPHLVAKGFKLNTGDSVEQFGYIFHGLPPDGELSYLEMGAAAIQPLFEAIREAQTSYRNTIPEFTLSGAGANTSGRALEFRADQFRRQAREIGTRLAAGIARLTQIAVCMENGEAFNPSEDWYRVDMPSPLPVFDQQRVMAMTQLVEAKILKRVDAVRMAQAMGFLDEETDATTYAAEMEAATGGPQADTGKVPLAIQQLALARERANTAGDTRLADSLGETIEQLNAQIAAA